jgi:hypothetical protein
MEAFLPRMFSSCIHTDIAWSLPVAFSLNHPFAWAEIIGLPPVIAFALWQIMVKPLIRSYRQAAASTEGAA